MTNSVKTQSNPPIFNRCAARNLKHATPDYFVRGTDLFPLRLPNKPRTTANAAVAVPCE